MSAPDKEPHPLGSTSGTRGYIRTCVRCGVTLSGWDAATLMLTGGNDCDN